MNEFFSSVLKKMRLLPVLVIVASMAFMVRVGDTVFQIKNLGSAYAEEKEAKVVKADGAAPPKEALPDPAEVAKKATEESGASKLDNPADASSDTKKGETVLSKKKDWQDSESDLDDSKVRNEVYDDLMERRQMIEQKEKALDQREALLKAGTEEVNKKVEELTAIRTEIQALLKKQNSEEEANTFKLVKIYEGMKPKDAAKIFNQLDMDVLLSVVTKMSERKVSPVIALMDPQKARSLTLFLSEQNKLPGTGSTPAGFGNPNSPPSLPESAIR